MVFNLRSLFQKRKKKNTKSTTEKRSYAAPSRPSHSVPETNTSNPFLISGMLVGSDTSHNNSGNDTSSGICESSNHSTGGGGCTGSSTGGGGGGGFE